MAIVIGLLQQVDIISTSSPDKSISYTASTRFGSLLWLIICEKIGHLDSNNNCSKPLSHYIPHACESLSRGAKPETAFYRAG
jgi:hypothetical protein